MKSFLCALVPLVCLVGCGKYGAPLPPEAFSPAPVQGLAATPLADGVQIAWQASPGDLRGKELKSMDGYNVYRREVTINSSGTFDTTSKSSGGDEFTLVGSVPDTHIAVLTQLRDEAKAQGKISRKVKVDPALTNFQYVDKGLTPNTSYVYKILGVNQGGVEGSARKGLQFTFQGEKTQIALVDLDDLRADEVADQIGAVAESEQLVHP